LDLRGKEVTFLIKKSMSGRVGWKIMPEDDNLNLKINATILEQVMTRIRWEIPKAKIGASQNAKLFSYGYGGTSWAKQTVIELFERV